MAYGHRKQLQRVTKVVRPTLTGAISRSDVRLALDHYPLIAVLYVEHIRALDGVWALMSLGLGGRGESSAHARPHSTASVRRTNNMRSWHIGEVSAYVYGPLQAALPGWFSHGRPAAEPH
ncbi:hypothetical protein EVAR_53705_1 [Eumeta japonica]|uniref:Uncharacterized protein n=1 Tax=Eumeta variegata TaxID=151549 RepID=A0A4C1ZD39_EUMVA|nr:hypothetical protein EVAR_53705_1 [Eumeta japonica]